MGKPTPGGWTTQALLAPRGQRAATRRRSGRTLGLPCCKKLRYASAVHLFVSALDVAADRWAARVLQSLAIAAPAEACGIGGRSLEQAGMQILRRGERLSVVGFVEALPRLLRAVEVACTARRALAKHRPDVVLLVDSPGFHLPLASFLVRRQVPIVYYFPPQAWAWREQRAAKLRNPLVRLAVTLPFEAAWWRERQVDATYVGHPLLDEPAPLRRPEPGVCACLPGSRPDEIRRHLHPMLDAARTAGFRPIVGLAAIPAGIASGLDAECLPAADALARAEVALVKSGTIALEAALAAVPSVIVYRMSSLSYALARRMVRVPFVGLPNLILGRKVFPEIVQRLQRAQLVSALFQVARVDAVAIAQELRHRLGAHGASRRVANLLHSQQATA